MPIAQKCLDDQNTLRMKPVNINPSPLRTSSNVESSRVLRSSPDRGDAEAEVGHESPQAASPNIQARRNAQAHRLDESPLINEAYLVRGGRLSGEVHFGDRSLLRQRPRGIAIPLLHAAQPETNQLFSAEKIGAKVARSAPWVSTMSVHNAIELNSAYGAGHERAHKRQRRANLSDAEAQAVPNAGFMKSGNSVSKSFFEKNKRLVLQNLQSNDAIAGFSPSLHQMILGMPVCGPRALNASGRNSIFAYCLRRLEVVPAHESLKNKLIEFAETETPD